VPEYFLPQQLRIIALATTDRRMTRGPGGPMTRPAMRSYLPADDPNPAARRQALEARRQRYFFNYDYIPGYPFLDHVPKGERFSAYYWLGRSASLALLPPNMLLAYLRAALVKPAAGLSAFRNLYTLYASPRRIEDWLEDDGFAEQRITGCNPQAIRRLAAAAEGLPFGDEHLEAVAGPGRSLAAEAAAGRLFLADFAALQHVKGSVWKGKRRTIPSPRALFWWDGPADKLRTVGIQVDRRPGARVFLPADPLLDWAAAKLAYQCADACHQEIGTHFAWTHMVMAPVAVVTRRQLAEQHPVHQLLAPHFLYYLYDNELGRVAFINPGGPVERMLGGTLQESLGIPLALYKDWNIRDFGLPAELARRGVADPATLPRYPLREDGMPIWQAIEAFVGQYLSLFYRSDRDLAGDAELQAWSAELASQDAAANGGRVAGMPERIDSIGLLQKILTTVIWICGPLHSMLNFSQWDYINLPNMSYSIYGEIPEAVGATTKETLTRMMPPFRQAAYQLWWCKILTSYRYDKLGHYAYRFSTPEADLALEAFRSRLRMIDREIAIRDARRPVPSPYLRPSLCINSINT
jgi:arachidonate 15-lipoxygenase